MTITIHFGMPHFARFSDAVGRAEAVRALTSTIAAIQRGSGGGDLTDPSTGDLIGEWYTDSPIPPEVRP